MSTVVAINGSHTEQFDPVDGGNGAAIIIAYGSEGMTNHLSGPWETMIREFANTLASKGFLVLIPDYLRETNTQPAADVFKLIHAHGASWEQTIVDAMVYAQSQRGIGHQRVGLLGFSLGGHLCLRLRARTKALIEFYAPAFGLSSLPSKLEINVQIHHGEEDSLVPYAENAEIINRMLQREEAVIDLHAYHGANHGFLGTDVNNTRARAESSELSLTFFEEHL